VVRASKSRRCRSFYRDSPSQYMRVHACTVGSIRTPPGSMSFQSELERESSFAVDETTRLCDASYCSEVSDQVYRMLRRRAQPTLAGGHSVLVEPCMSDPRRAWMSSGLPPKLDLPCHGLWLTAEPSRLIERVSARRDDGATVA
jgi:uncharacterized protein